MTSAAVQSSRLPPSGASWLVGVAVALLVGSAAISTPVDPDLWGHLRFGGDIVQSGRIVQTDIYSFTTDRAWINHEWLTEVILYGIYRSSGATGLIVFKVAMIAVLLALVWTALRRAAVGRTAAMIFTVAAFVGTFWRTHNVRPQLLSVVLCATLIALLREADRGKRRILLLLPPMMIVWSNLHGGWIVGGGLIGIWILVRVCERDRSLNSRMFLLAIGLASLAGTLINPHGIEMWRFLAETVRPSRDDIEEWRWILIYPVALGVPWLLVAVFGAAATWRARPRPWPFVIMAAILGVASFRVNRLDGFFFLVVVMGLGPSFPIRFRSNRNQLPIGGAAVRRSSRGVAIITAVTLAAMLVSATRILAPRAGCVAILGVWMPEEDAARFIVQNGLSGRMITWFDWGEYAIWHFGPSLQVSMDGRRETVYSDTFIRAHRRFYAGDDTASVFLESLRPDFIWLPLHLPVVEKLPSLGWTPIFQGPISAVFARPGGTYQPVRPSTALGERCFPGV